MLLIQEPALPLSFQLSSGGGPAVLILRRVHRGELLSPLPGALSLGAVYPVRPLLSPRYKMTPEGTTTVVVASSAALSQLPHNYHSVGCLLVFLTVAFAVQLSVHRDLEAPRSGSADLHSSGLPGGRSVLAVLCPPGLCLSQWE